MQNIPLLSVPRQTIQTQLDNQTVLLNVYQLRYGLFIDVTLGGTLLIGAVICKNQTLVIRDGYWGVAAGFSGDFTFNDLYGTSDPVYTGLGTQYELLYLSEAELNQLGVTTE